MMQREISLVVAYLRNNQRFLMGLEGLANPLREDAIKEEVRKSRLDPYYFQLVVELLTGALDLDAVFREIGELFPDAILSKHRKSITRVMGTSVEATAILQEEALRLLKEFKDADKTVWALDQQAFSLKEISHIMEKVPPVARDLIRHEISHSRGIKAITPSDEDADSVKRIMGGN